MFLLNLNFPLTNFFPLTKSKTAKDHWYELLSMALQGIEIVSATRRCSSRSINSIATDWTEPVSNTTASIQEKNSQTSENYDPCNEEVEPYTLSEIPHEITMVDLKLLSYFLGSGQNHENPIKKENRIRRKRFWTIVQFLMNHLLEVDPCLYVEAKLTIQDAIRREKGQNYYHRNVIGRVKRDLKEVVGLRQWRRAESHLFSILKNNAKYYTELSSS